MFRFTVGRLESSFDSCMVVQTAQSLGSSADLHQVITAIVKSDSFVVRTVADQ
jgi:hypothetical protein